MRKRLLAGLGVAAVLAVLGATAYAAWTQGEAAGHAAGYAQAKTEDKPRLTEQDVVSLAQTFARNSTNSAIRKCLDSETKAAYRGRDLWIVNCESGAVAVSDATGRVHGPPGTRSSGPVRPLQPTIPFVPIKPPEFAPLLPRRFTPDLPKRPQVSPLPWGTPVFRRP